VQPDVLVLTEDHALQPRRTLEELHEFVGRIEVLPPPGLGDDERSGSGKMYMNLGERLGPKAGRMCCRA